MKRTLAFDERASIHDDTTGGSGFLRRIRLLLSLLLAIAAVAGCVTNPDPPRLFLGMSRERLLTRFGAPLRVERSAKGGEDWYYSFSSPPEMQASSYHDPQDQSDSVSVTISKSLGRRECPVHLSPEGYVIEPIPRGLPVKP